MPLGTVPNGVSSPCGLVTSTTDPTIAPRFSAISCPSTIGGIAATRARTAARESGDSGGAEGESAKDCRAADAPSAVAESDEDLEVDATDGCPTSPGFWEKRGFLPSSSGSVASPEPAEG